MRGSVFQILTIVLSLATSCIPCQAQTKDAENGISAKMHPWGRFRPGAWKQVRVVTETLDEQGRVVGTNTADVKTTLLDIDDQGVTLEVQTCMEVAGKRFQADPQTVRQGFHGESSDLKFHAKPPTDGNVAIEGRERKCKVWQLDAKGPTEKTTVRVWFSPSLWPYVLRREFTVSDLEGKQKSVETNVETVALDMPVQLHDEIQSGAYLKTVHRNGKSVVTTLAVVSPDVPGGVVSHSQKEVDASGRIVRRSTLELVDYSLRGEDDHRGPVNRKRANRRSYRE
jgi:hypothetical protein